MLEANRTLRPVARRFRNPMLSVVDTQLRLRSARCGALVDTKAVQRQPGILASCGLDAYLDVHMERLIPLIEPSTMGSTLLAVRP